MGLFGMGKARDGGGAQSAPDWIVAVADRIMPLVEQGRIDVERVRGNGPPWPAEGARRKQWLISRLSDILVHPQTDAVFVMDSDVRRAVVAELSMPGCVEHILSRSDPRSAVERIATMIAWRRHQLSLTGVQGMRRIMSEEEVLTRMSDERLIDRFASSPHSRLDRPPADLPRRRAWTIEMLRGEVAGIAAGMISPAEVAMLARVCRALVPDRFEAAEPIAVVSAARDPVAIERAATARRDRARQLASLDRGTVESRFSMIPGFLAADTADRSALMSVAVVAEELRRLARLPGSAGSTESGLSVELANLLVDTSEGLRFAGDLVVAGERVCGMESPGDGVIEAHAWSEGFGPDDLAALDMYFGATGEPRDEGTVVDSLSLRVLDIVAMRVAVDGYREAAASAVLFRVDGTDGASIMRVAVPADGDREGAIAFMLSREPAALPLDRLSIEDAAMTWIALS